jgi:hypothetical protein
MAYSQGAEQKTDILEVSFWVTSSYKYLVLFIQVSKRIDRNTLSACGI